MHLLTLIRASRRARVGVLLVGLSVAGGVYAAHGSATTKHDAVIKRLATAPLPPLGTPITLTGQAQSAMQHTGATGQPYFIETHGGRSFYRLTNPNGESCFGSGPDRANPANTYTLGVAMCSNEFPSTTTPVLDMSVYDWLQNGEAHLYRIEGVAATGVATIAYLDTTGAVAASVPVVNNIYTSSNVPSAALSQIEALDSNGSVVWTEPLTAQ